MKKIKAIIKLQIPAGQATPAPPVGPALAQHGVNIAEFCQKFNEQTKQSQGFKIPVEITVFEDRTYNFKLKQPPASELLKKAAGIEKGSGEQRKTKVAKISQTQLKEIAQKKMEDLNTKDIAKAMKIIEGTAKSMGIEIVP
ncbi:MAG: 50S ribosomal protein L11 [Candidatus Nealsonbacteria bacterium CG_4_9_14_0_2_um_filter_37_38]|uniref:Large ribosomal subunit protein uL11 n=1 Tax=Candidatus Nealsonbacteria bacterium CG_4_10_14_0_8_um_filter_37_14 TaxID=1974684 RepID=A0A2M7R615_9BACT|nr:MAG: 50S ribosomal protein L11 [Candidatus Nealsonbacteria bacterium CG11_big_fil_rev_8_21_14_0_20_37_68]PIW92242.1 MAG: 50S ribosomal protein L11 [Candidatus Nealsonbacteria bacterium CG_4_8_14_3_um_filter_37_23]PIY88954.1 MAG: 50S ribosomal protein L11 [Candidatus Nealsonbacteria bacterium CG_4_10_14_0_8_um_filter_37_14]PJC51893.1 MAG: 50S ribosomal protein L11 [Candidatus Nealsonbacteria bacterium CG_4_9_14_0_2_um_filter_37_38]